MSLTGVSVEPTPIFCVTERFGASKESALMAPVALTSPVNVVIPVTNKFLVVTNPTIATSSLNVEIPDTSSLFAIEVVPPSDVKFRLLPVAEIALGDSIPIETLLIVAPLVPIIGPENVETPATLTLSKFV